MFESLQKASILTLAKFIRWGVDAYIFIPWAINVGNAASDLKAYEGMQPGDPRYDEERKRNAEDILKNRQTSESTRRHREAIRRLHGLYNEPDARRTRKPLVNSAADVARAYDTNKTKATGHRYVLKTGSVDLDSNKANYGINHPQLLQAIVPMSLLHKYGADADFDDSVRASEYEINHTTLPAFMFDVENYNPRSPKKSLLRGHMPVRVLKQIFTGPSSALEEQPGRKRSTRPGNAMIAGQKEVTPEMIAYACIQAWHFISRLDSWSRWDESFHMEAFYYEVRDLFKKKESKWVKDTLEWWNK
ncbi:hypothetical protein ACEPAF_983 [Sanghuangporus sanghuang]